VTAILEVENLVKSFGGVHAIRDLSLSIEEGSVEGLIGPNGAGKSTAIEIMSGFLRPDKGTVRFRGETIQGLAPHKVSRLGLMRSFQLAREWPQLSVLENMLVAAVDNGREALWRALLTPWRLHREQREDRERVGAILEEFGLYGLRNDMAGTLSGGQKRLLEFARLVAAKPRLVLLDEPMAGVNPTMGAHIQDAIRRFTERGITVMLVEHNLSFVEALCGSVTVMAHGTQIARGQMATLRLDETVREAYLGSNV
jgi:neutral amino acid transport system ATP-binding protein